MEDGGGKRERESRDTQININCRGECKGYLLQPSVAHMGCPIAHEIEQEWEVEPGREERDGRGLCRKWIVAFGTRDNRFAYKSKYRCQFAAFGAHFYGTERQYVCVCVCVW